MIQCKTCKKLFETKRDYERHTNNLRPCSPDIYNMVFKIEKQKSISNIACKFCDKKYSNQSHLNRHLLNSNDVCYKNRHSSLVINIDDAANNISINITSPHC